MIIFCEGILVLTQDMDINNVCIYIYILYYSVYIYIIYIMYYVTTYMYKYACNVRDIYA